MKDTIKGLIMFGFGMGCLISFLTCPESDIKLCIVYAVGTLSGIMIGLMHIVAPNDEGEEN